MKIKRYIREFVNDLKKECQEYEQLKGLIPRIDRVLKLKEKGMITDFETMELLIRERKEYLK